MRWVAALAAVSDASLSRLQQDLGRLGGQLAPGELDAPLALDEDTGAAVAARGRGRRAQAPAGPPPQEVGKEVGDALQGLGADGIGIDSLTGLPADAVETPGAAAQAEVADAIRAVEQEEPTERQRKNDGGRDSNPFQDALPALDMDVSGGDPGAAGFAAAQADAPTSGEQTDVQQPPAAEPKVVAPVPEMPPVDAPQPAAETPPVAASVEALPPQGSSGPGTEEAAAGAPPAQGASEPGLEGAAVDVDSEVDAELGSGAATQAVADGVQAQAAAAGAQRAQQQADAQQTGSAEFASDGTYRGDVGMDHEDHDGEEGDRHLPAAWLKYLTEKEKPVWEKSWGFDRSKGIYGGAVPFQGDATQANSASGVAGAQPLMADYKLSPLKPVSGLAKTVTPQPLATGPLAPEDAHAMGPLSQASFETTTPGVQLPGRPVFRGSGKTLSVANKVTTTVAPTAQENVGGLVLPAAPEFAWAPTAAVTPSVPSAAEAINRVVEGLSAPKPAVAAKQAVVPTSTPPHPASYDAPAADPRVGYGPSAGGALLPPAVFVPTTSTAAPSPIVVKLPPVTTPPPMTTPPPPPPPPRPQPIATPAPPAAPEEPESVMMPPVPPAELGPPVPAEESFSMPPPDYIFARPPQPPQAPPQQAPGYGYQAQQPNYGYQPPPQQPSSGYQQPPPNYGPSPYYGYQQPPQQAPPPQVVFGAPPGYGVPPPVQSPPQQPMPPQQSPWAQPQGSQSVTPQQAYQMYLGLLNVLDKKRAGTKAGLLETANERMFGSEAEWNPWTQQAYAAALHKFFASEDSARKVSEAQMRKAIEVAAGRLASRDDAIATQVGHLRDRAESLITQLFMSVTDEKRARESADQALRNGLQSIDDSTQKVVGSAVSLLQTGAKEVLESSLAATDGATRQRFAEELKRLDAARLRKLQVALAQQTSQHEALLADAIANAVNDEKAELEKVLAANGLSQSKTPVASTSFLASKKQEPTGSTVAGERTEGSETEAATPADNPYLESQPAAPPAEEATVTTTVVAAQQAAEQAVEAVAEKGPEAVFPLPPSETEMSETSPAPAAPAQEGSLPEPLVDRDTEQVEAAPEAAAATSAPTAADAAPEAAATPSAPTGASAAASVAGETAQANVPENSEEPADEKEARAAQATEAIGGDSAPALDDGADVGAEEEKQQAPSTTVAAKQEDDGEHPKDPDAIAEETARLIEQAKDHVDESDALVAATAPETRAPPPTTTTGIPAHIDVSEQDVNDAIAAAASEEGMQAVSSWADKGDSK